MNGATLKLGAAFQLRNESAKNVSTLETDSHQLQARTQLGAARPDNNNVTHHEHLVLIQHLSDGIAFYIFYELGKGQQDIVANMLMPAACFERSLKSSSGTWQHTSPLLSSVHESFPTAGTHRCTPLARNSERSHLRRASGEIP